MASSSEVPGSVSLVSQQAALENAPSPRETESLDNRVKTAAKRAFAVIVLSVLVMTIGKAIIRISAVIKRNWHSEASKTKVILAAVPILLFFLKQGAKSQQSQQWATELANEAAAQRPIFESFKKTALDISQRASQVDSWKALFQLIQEAQEAFSPGLEGEGRIAPTYRHYQQSFNLIKREIQDYEKRGLDSAANAKHLADCASRVQKNLQEAIVAVEDWIKILENKGRSC